MISSLFVYIYIPYVYRVPEAAIRSLSAARSLVSWFTCTPLIDVIDVLMAGIVTFLRVQTSDVIAGIVTSLSEVAYVYKLVMLVPFALTKASSVDVVSAIFLIVETAVVTVPILALAVVSPL